MPAASIRLVAIAALLAVAGTAFAAGLAAWQRGQSRPALFADAEDAGAVTRGARVYAERCGACHGRHLQGQRLWQLDDADQHRRAPALDQTGPAWRRSDAALFRIVSAGSAPAMPAFGARLDAEDRLAVIAFVKSRWPVGLRVGQAALNPEQAGMPKTGQAWSFAAFCGR